MNDAWFSHYLISIMKEGIYPFSKIADGPNTLDQEEIQYLIRFSSNEEEYPSNLPSGQPKIFVIKSGDKFIYVGYTSESMVSRFSSGLTESLGKAFILEGEFESKELDLYIFEFPLFAEFSKNETRNYFQSIQSELIYLIKTQTSKWPMLQKQINLSNNFQKDYKKTALDMLKVITKGLPII